MSGDSFPRNGFTKWVEQQDGIECYSPDMDVRETAYKKAREDLDAVEQLPEAERPDALRTLFKQAWLSQPTIVEQFDEPQRAANKSNASMVRLEEIITSMCYYNMNRQHEFDQIKPEIQAHIHTGLIHDERQERKPQ